jgi:hypothetical protein
MLQHDKYILGNYGIMDAKGHLWVWNKKIMMWGHHDMMAPFHILHNNQSQAMPLTSSVRDVPSSQPKVQVTAKTWDPRIGPILIGGEVHETQQILQDFH